MSMKLIIFAICLPLLLIVTASCNKTTDRDTTKGDGVETVNAVKYAALSVLRENKIKNIVEISGTQKPFCNSLDDLDKYVILNYNGDAKKHCKKVDFQSTNFYDVKDTDFTVPDDFALVALGVNLWPGEFPENSSLLANLVEKAKIIILESPINRHRQNDQASAIATLAESKGKKVYINARITNKSGEILGPLQLTILK